MASINSDIIKLEETEDYKIEYCEINNKKDLVVHSFIIKNFQSNSFEEIIRNLRHKYICGTYNVIVIEAVQTYQFSILKKYGFKFISSESFVHYTAILGLTPEKEATEEEIKVLFRQYTFLPSDSIYEGIKHVSLDEDKVNSLSVDELSDMMYDKIKGLQSFDSSFYLMDEIEKNYQQPSRPEEKAKKKKKKKRNIFSRLLIPDKF